MVELPEVEVRIIPILAAANAFATIKVVVVAVVAAVPRRTLLLPLLQLQLQLQVVTVEPLPAVHLLVEVVATQRPVMVLAQTLVDAATPLAPRAPHLPPPLASAPIE